MTTDIPHDGPEQQGQRELYPVAEVKRLYRTISELREEAASLRRERDAALAELAKAREALARTEWKPLTDERVIEIRKETKALDRQWGDTIAFARAIEAAVLAAKE